MIIQLMVFLTIFFAIIQSSNIWRIALAVVLVSELLDFLNVIYIPYINIISLVTALGCALWLVSGGYKSFNRKII